MQQFLSENVMHMINNMSRVCKRNNLSYKQATNHVISSLNIYYWHSIKRTDKRFTKSAMLHREQIITDKLCNSSVTFADRNLRQLDIFFC